MINESVNKNYCTNGCIKPIRAPVHSKLRGVFWAATCPNVINYFILSIFGWFYSMGYYAQLKPFWKPKSSGYLTVFIFVWRFSLQRCWCGYKNCSESQRYCKRNCWRKGISPYMKMKYVHIPLTFLPHS